MSSIADTSQMPAVVSKSLNMHEYNLESSTYEYNNRNSTTNNSTIPLSTAGGELVEFIIPPGYVNFGKSYLTGYFESGGVSGVFPIAFANGLTFVSSITVQDSATGTILMQTNNVNRLSEYYMRREMRYDDIAARDCAINTGSGIPDGFDGIHEGIALKTTSSLRYDNSTKRASDFRVEPGYLMTQTILGGAATISGTLNYGFRYQFSDVLKHTFLGLNKDLYIPTEIKISMTMARHSQSVFTSLSGAGFDTLAEPTAGGNLKNFQLMLASPVNAAVRSKLMSEVQSGQGMKLLIETLHSTNNTLSTSDQTVVLRVQKGLGDTIKKVDFIPYNTATTGTNVNNWYDHSNITVSGNPAVGVSYGCKVSSCYGKVNDKRWNVQDFTESKGDYWKQNREYFKDTGINSLTEFQQNWGFTMKFDNSESNLNKSTNLPDENFNDGLPIDGEKQLELYATTGVSGAALNWVTGAVITKHIIIKSNGLYLVN